jgi:hypothetical protein
MKTSQTSEKLNLPLLLALQQRQKFGNLESDYDDQTNIKSDQRHNFKSRCDQDNKSMKLRICAE